MKDFLHNEAPKYAAATVEWQGGHNPDVHFLDASKKVVSTHDLSPLSEQQIHELLNQNGIFTHTPKPEFRPPTFAATAKCAAWRQTADCNPEGAREEFSDEACHTTIDNGRSGYCECVGRSNVEYMCEHTAFTCEESCAEPETNDSAAGAEDEEEQEF